MEQTNLLEEFMNLSNEAEELSAKVAGLKDAVTAVLEQNAELRMNNGRLRERIEQLTAEQDDAEPTVVEHTAEAGMSKSRKNLEKIYMEGYHVCSKFYGQHLEPGESCAFCTDILYGERQR
ncbi:DNA replication initiation control protein YabA [Lacticaseibacillus hulanensis]|jgi:regulator of replication initiation timing|uniref:DNA replication initiation control protein YabA n=1 Tax=Lacticaseibacillus hulanensis TaxID=2493111 RepID=UPI000FD75694|nr:DNA replication initiation control protein YabA [Lacticaseibacillus hulanensis]